MIQIVQRQRRTFRVVGQINVKEIASSFSSVHPTMRIRFAKTNAHPSGAWGVDGTAEEITAFAQELLRRAADARRMCVEQTDRHAAIDEENALAIAAWHTEDEVTPSDAYDGFGPMGEPDSIIRNGTDWTLYEHDPICDCERCRPGDPGDYENEAMR